MFSIFKGKKNNKEATADKKKQDAIDYLSHLTSSQGGNTEPVVFEELTQQILVLFYKDEAIKAYPLINTLRKLIFN